jgi:hypothetical protein
MNEEFQNGKNTPTPRVFRPAKVRGREKRSHVRSRWQEGETKERWRRQVATTRPDYWGPVR